MVLKKMTKIGGYVPLSTYIPAALNPFTIISLSAFKWRCKSTIHLACNGFITESLRETFTSGGAMPSLICFALKFDLPSKRCTFQKRMSLQLC